MNIDPRKNLIEMQLPVILLKIKKKKNVSFSLYKVISDSLYICIEIQSLP